MNRLLACTLSCIKPNKLYNIYDNQSCFIIIGKYASNNRMPIDLNKID